MVGSCLAFSDSFIFQTGQGWQNIDRRIDRLTVKLTVPLELDNRYADRVGETDWIFHGESAGETPYTGDTENVGLWLLLLCCAGAGTLTLTSQLRKKKN